MGIFFGIFIDLLFSTSFVKNLVKMLTGRFYPDLNTPKVKGDFHASKFFLPIFYMCKVVYTVHRQYFSHSQKLWVRFKMREWAEVAAWFKNYDEAKTLYLEADMRMLAVRMRKRPGDWFKVVQLLKTGTGGNDTEIEKAYNEVSF